MAKHWTAETSDALAHKAAFDFIAQIEKKLATSEVNQVALASKMGITEGAVSKVLNNPQNLTLKTIAKYSKALGIKFAIVAYDDDDAENEKGLVSSEIFTTCWQRAGKPRDVWSLDLQPQCSATEGTIHLDALAVGATFESTPPWLSERLVSLLGPYKEVNRGTHELTSGQQIFFRAMNSATGVWGTCQK